MSAADMASIDYDKHEWSATEISEKIKDFKWYQCIELAPGIITPGHPPSKDVCRLFDSIVYDNKEVIDIGTLHGMWAFEAHKRGARLVNAMNISDGGDTAGLANSFRFCRSVLGAKNVNYIEQSLYNLKGIGYDVALCFGFLHHLRHPLLALEIIRDNLAPAGNLVLETVVIPGDESTCNFYHSVPFMHDSQSVWVPTPLCLLEWIVSAGLRVIDHWSGPEGSMRYHVLTVKR